MKKLVLLLFLVPSLIFSQDLSNLEFKDLSGNKFLIKDNLDNDATIVLFWATWCIPCKKEFPEIQKLVKKYPDKKISIITISQDTPRSLVKVKSYANTHDYGFIYLIDPEGIGSSKLMVNAVPHSMLLDKTGKVFYSHIGYRQGDEAELEKKMLDLWKQDSKGKTE